MIIQLKKHYGKKQLFLIAFITLFVLILSNSVSATPTYNLTNINGTVISDLKYGAGQNNNYTSYSYKDNSVRNENAFLEFCSNDTSTYSNTYIELAYASNDCNKIIPMLIMPALMSGFNSSNCSFTDVDIASFKAFYPGVLYLLIGNSSLFRDDSTNTTNQSYTNIIYCGRTSTILNGSYKVDVSVDDISDTVSFSAKNIYDDLLREITNREGSLIFELEKSDNTSLGSKVVPASSSASYNYSFEGGEKLYINGILSLQVIPFNPCGVINDSGYYIINSSSWNKNDSCIIIENTSGVTLNFANKTVDGDYQVNGSLKNDSCAVVIRNSANITISDLRTEQFRFGLCVYNSSVIVVSGTYDKENIEGIYIENSSSITISNLRMYNNNSEIRTVNSITMFSRITTNSANFSLESDDIIVRTVSNPPEQPSGLINISQWLEVTNNSNSTWAIIKFHYSKPLPNNVLEATLDLYKYNGSQWFPVPSYTDKINKEIYSINITNFSIFAPLGEEVNMTPKNPPPSPPTTGNIEQEIIQQLVPPQITPPKLKLKLYNHTIKIQQGGTGTVGFNLTNLGTLVKDVIVRAEIKRGWKTADVRFAQIKPREIKNGTIYLKIYENEIPGTYLINVNAIVNGNLTADTDVLKVIVLPRQKLSKLDILEVAPKLTLEENRWHRIPILVQNNGDFNLTNITLSFEYASDCIDKIKGVYNLSIGERKSLIYKVKVKSAFKTCNAILVLKSGEGAIAFSPIVIDVVPQLFGKFRVIPILFIILTIWSAYILFNKFKQYREVMVVRKRRKRTKKGKI